MMPPLRRLISIFVLLTFILSSFGPVAQADDRLFLNLPAPGTMVRPTEAFTPALLRGVIIDPKDPLRLDFIVNKGQSIQEEEVFKKDVQRMVHYFLASLTIPQKDLWVNLSPVEKDRIVPDTLIKTELGRDLLAMDYMLKQLTASLVYPEEKLGAEFWGKVREEAKKRFGTTDIPVNTFNKVWILPEEASVYEKGNSAYVTKIRLKVMLEADYLAKEKIAPVSAKDEASKELLRQIIVPVIEKEVNEGKAYAHLRQMVYALTLAQWYQDVFKAKLLNGDYSGHSKIGGIDVSSPENKQLIYQQYLAAYKKGVFNYIKEENDPVTNTVIPHKIFSGGFRGAPIKRDKAMLTDIQAASGDDVLVAINLAPVVKDKAQVAEPLFQWYDLARPLALLRELKALFVNGPLDEEKFSTFLDKYTSQVDGQPLYPVQSTWPVLKAISLLSKDQEDQIVKATQKKYEGVYVPRLADAILLMANQFRPDGTLKDWLKEEAPHLVGRRIYLTAAEIHYQEGGLGPVMEFHGKGMHDLGADTTYIEADYQTRQDRGNKDGTDPLDYKDMGIEDTGEVRKYTVEVGDLKDRNVTHTVNVIARLGVDRNGIKTWRFRDVQADGSSFYTKMLYKYGTPANPISMEESMAFLNVATAELISILEKERKDEQKAGFKPAIIYNNDGQLAPVQAVLQSRMEKYSPEVNAALKGAFFAFTTHTYRNRGGNNDVNWGINHFIKHMMGISDRFVNAFRNGRQPVDYTSGGINLADWVGTVSNKHRDDVSLWNPHALLMAVTNGAVPDRMGVNYQRVFQRLYPLGDYLRPTTVQLAAVDRVLKQEYNDRKIKTANGGVVEVDIDRPMIGFVRRLVGEKAGRERAFTNENIWWLVERGYNVVLQGRNQNTDESRHMAEELKTLEREIAAAKERNPGKFKGRFFFVESFTGEEKLAALAALNMQVQDSDDHTGAAEYSEEDVTANAGYQAGATWREGVILDQGILMDVNDTSTGNTLAPKEDTAQSWRETVFEPMMRAWEKGPDTFYAGAVMSPSVNRIMNYLITSSAYLLEWETTIAREEREAATDAILLKRVVQVDREEIPGLLRNGRNGVQGPFAFKIMNQGEQIADNRGLDGFIRKQAEIEAKFGYDASLAHFLNGDFQRYLTDLFHGTILDETFRDFLQDLNASQASTFKKFERLNRFVASIKDVLVTMDKAQITNPTGGIDLRKIAVSREGILSVDLDQAVSIMLTNASGLRGTIMTIKPVANVLTVLEAVK